jgi:serine/threonine kinase 32
VFKPSSDRINFDATYDLEELLLEDQPLEPKAKRRKPRRRKDDGSEKDAHYQLIEEKFKTFDYTIFEKYVGWVNPVTKCVADPPGWVKPAAVEVANRIERESQDGIGANSGDLSTLAGISLDNGIKT